MANSLNYNGIYIFSNDNDIRTQLQTIILAPKFQNYIDSLDRNILEITSLRIDVVKWFCNPSKPEPTKLGFLYMELIAKDKRTLLPVPGVVFLRGNAVAVYVIVIVEGKKYVLLTKQMRVPLGRLVEEIPAGMMDSNNCFVGVAMKEISEETGLNPPKISELILLGEPIIPSAGGCDEQIQLFFWQTSVTSQLLQQMKRKIYGAQDENESIQLVFVPFEKYEDKLLTMGDVKAICAHQFAKKLGLLEETVIVSSRRFSWFR
jgi:ADP-sugar diphosphatase